MPQDINQGLMPLVQMLHKALGIQDWSKELAAGQNLAAQPGGSIMANYSEPTASSKFLQENPLLKTILDMVKGGAPSPLDAAGGSSLAHVPGTYRRLGLERQVGSLNPAQFVKQLMNESNYPRYKQLVENQVRRKLGDEFTGFRGAAVGDPLMNVVSKGGLPNATAISTDPTIAGVFAKLAAEKGKAGRVAEGKFTPESVLSLLPSRKTAFANEKELVVDPRWAKDLKTIDRSVAPDKLNPYVEMKGAGDDLLTTAMQEALAGFKTNRPIPGSPIRATGGPMSIQDDLKQALEALAQPPATSRWPQSLPF